MIGGARLPNGPKKTHGVYDVCEDLILLGRLIRRAVRAKTVQLTGPNSLRQLGTYDAQTWYTMGQRLGACLGFGPMQGPHSSWTLVRRLGRAGASPHQTGGLSHQIYAPRSSFLLRSPR
jgi:hypothetical protein